MKRTQRHHRQPSGAIALLTIVTISAFTLAIITAVSVIATTLISNATTHRATEQVFYAAESGLQDALYRIGVNSGLQTPNCSELNPTYTISVNGEDVNVCIVASGFKRILTAWATNVPTNITRKLTVTASVQTFTGGFDFAAIAGTGGFILDQQTTINGGSGKGVFSNNNVVGNNQTTIIGNLSIFGGPTTPSFPTACADPCLKDISSISGDVHSRTIDNATISGGIWTNSPINGAKAFDYPNPILYPISPSDIATLINSIPSANVILGSTVTGNYTINGNYSVSGDVFLGNNESLTVNGNILYIDGDLTLGANSSQPFSLRIKSDIANQNSLIVIVKKKIVINNNNNILGSGNEKSFVLLISRKGNDGENAIESSNNSSAAIFFAPDGIIVVKKGSISNATAYKIHLEQQTSITYNNNLPYFNIPPSGSTTPPLVDPTSWQEL